jgi:hypothetical protein
MWVVLPKDSRRPMPVPDIEGVGRGRDGKHFTKEKSGDEV